LFMLMFSFVSATTDYYFDDFSSDNFLTNGGNVYVITTNESLYFETDRDREDYAYLTFSEPFPEKINLTFWIEFTYNNDAGQFYVMLSDTANSAEHVNYGISNWFYGGSSTFGDGGGGKVVHGLDYITSGTKNINTNEDEDISQNTKIKAILEKKSDSEFEVSYYSSSG